MRAETITTYPLPDILPAATTEQFIRFTQGDEKGLTWLYQQYYNKLLSYGLRIVNDEFAVNTIVQEAFLKAWAFRERLLHPRHVYCFMRLNIKWDCCDHLERIIKTRRHTVTIDHPEYYEHSGHWEPEEEDNTHARAEEQLQAINKIIPLLPQERRGMLRLYYNQGMSYQQIAKRFGSGSGCVRCEIEKGVKYVKMIVGNSEMSNARI